MDSQTEKQTVKNFLETRSEKAFAVLYKRYANAMFRLAAKLNNGDAEGARDIVQEAWIRAIRGLPAFAWNSELKSWLCGIVINCCREFRRKDHVAGSITAETESRAGTASQVENKIDIRAALKRLPEGYREILVLHDFEGYKHHEISTMLEISEGTSKSQLFNARKAVRELIK